jgi:hypothetical protein
VADDEKDGEETKYGLREDVIWTGRRRDFGESMRSSFEGVEG